MSIFSKANKAFREGMYEDAIAGYRDAIKINPDFYVYYENIGSAFEASGMLEQAVDAYRKALKLRPGSVFSQKGLNRLKPFSDHKNNEEILGIKFDRFSPISVSVDVSVTQSVDMRERDRGQISSQDFRPCVDGSRLRKEYCDAGLDNKSDNFLLYRIIGNDLYPRHSKGQSRENLKFILENESDLEGCEKRWVVNRIFDREEFSKIIDLLSNYGQKYIVIPFDIEEYRNISWDVDVFGGVNYFASNEFLCLSQDAKSRAVTAAYRLKNNYVMNNNGARNLAIRDGGQEAKWILPWDGNCFLTQSAWESIRGKILDAYYLRYFIVPMARLSDNSELFDENFIPNPTEEPQIVFRCDSKENFNENFCYGRRSKVELFWRLGVPGKWDEWRDDPWDQARSPLSAEACQFDHAGWVARLFCGAKEAARQSESGARYRWKIRQNAILETIDKIEIDSGIVDESAFVPSRLIL